MNNSILDVQTHSNKSMETLIANLLQHLEYNKGLTPRRLYFAGVHYLEQSLGLDYEELPSNPNDLIIYNGVFDALYDYFKDNI
ncbi:hypothetical protein J4437_04600 [Candidatus Woesearchaeota archaeon]|nr:hypothetical protein [Candidatus Woesearchaeota archaeon]